MSVSFVGEVEGLQTKKQEMASKSVRVKARGGAKHQQRRRRRNGTGPLKYVVGGSINSGGGAYIKDLEPCELLDTTWKTTPCSSTCGGIMISTRTYEGACPRSEVYREVTCQPVVQAADLTSYCGCDDWTAWSEWSNCSRPCGAGTQQQTRTGTLGHCPEKDKVQIQACNVQECHNVTCEWSDWLTVARCTATCYKEMQQFPSYKQVRSVTFQPEQNPCTGSASRELKCDNVTALCPEDCFVTTWSAWGDCSQTCGTSAQRSRSRLQVGPIGGGKPCALTSLLQDTQSCGTMPPCPENCSCSDAQYEDWSAWTACDQACDYGYQHSGTSRLASTAQCCPPRTRTRSCTTGVNCTDMCDYTWSDWSSCWCDETSTATQNRSLIKNLSAPSGCPSPYGTRYTTCNADCGQGRCSTWGAWSDWSGDCKGSSRKRHAVCAEFPSVKQDWQSCGPGDAGVNDSSCEWGDWAPKVPCMQTVSKSVEMAYRNFTPARGHGSYCNFSHGRQTSPPCSINDLGDWSDWGGNCSTTNSQRRQRSDGAASFRTCSNCLLKAPDYCPLLWAQQGSCNDQVSGLLSLVVNDGANFVADPLAYSVLTDMLQWSESCPFIVHLDMQLRSNFSNNQVDIDWGIEISDECSQAAILSLLPLVTTNATATRTEINQRLIASFWNRSQIPPQLWVMNVLYFKHQFLKAADYQSYLGTRCSTFASSTSDSGNDVFSGNNTWIYSPTAEADVHFYGGASWNTAVENCHCTCYNSYNGPAEISPMTAPPPGSLWPLDQDMHSVATIHYCSDLDSGQGINVLGPSWTCSCVQPDCNPGFSTVVAYDTVPPRLSLPGSHLKFTWQNCTLTCEASTASMVARSFNHSGGYSLPQQIASETDMFNFLVACPQEPQRIWAQLNDSEVFRAGNCNSPSVATARALAKNLFGPAALITLFWNMYEYTSEHAFPCRNFSAFFPNADCTCPFANEPEIASKRCHNILNDTADAGQLLEVGSSFSGTNPVDCTSFNSQLLFSDGSFPWLRCVASQAPGATPCASNLCLQYNDPDTYSVTFLNCGLSCSLTDAAHLLKTSVTITECDSKCMTSDPVYSCQDSVQQDVLKSFTQPRAYLNSLTGLLLISAVLSSSLSSLI